MNADVVTARHAELVAYRAMRAVYDCDDSTPAECQAATIVAYRAYAAVRAAEAKEQA